MVWSATDSYEWGDIVMHPTSNEIFTYTSLDPYIVGTDPESVSGAELWEYCSDPITYSDTTDRLGPYVAFILKACKDCGLPGPVQPTVQPQAQYIDNTATFGTPTEMGGTNIEITR